MNKQQQDSDALLAVACYSSAVDNLLIMIVFLEGLTARAHREPRTDNPYPAGELAAAAWFSGWDEA
jgi:hypothetical protein